MLKTILVDDERPALNALEHLLQEYPEVEIAGTFTNIQQALDFIHQDQSVQLIFLDIDMPKLNGIEAARQIRSIHPQIEIVYITAYQHFAVDAFEVNAADYIMKPVSRKRLDKTLERLAQKPTLSDTQLRRRERGDFLNTLITGKFKDRAEMISKARTLELDLTQTFPLFFIIIADSNRRLLGKDPQALSPLLQKFQAKLDSQSNIIAWEIGGGIAVWDLATPSSAQSKAVETAKAEQLKKLIESLGPGISAYIGIAGIRQPDSDWRQWFLQARNAAVIGRRISPESGVYHFLDTGYLSLLDQYLNQPIGDLMIENTIGKILEYDRKNGGELCRTLEKLIICNNLQEVADSLFIHYKTVTFRKQSIEKILGFAINSFYGRTMLGLALTLYYLREFPAIETDAT